MKLLKSVLLTGVLLANSSAYAITDEVYETTKLKFNNENVMQFLQSCSEVSQMYADSDPGRADVYSDLCQYNMAKLLGLSPSDYERFEVRASKDGFLLGLLQQSSLRFVEPQNDYAYSYEERITVTCDRACQDKAQRRDLSLVLYDYAIEGGVSHSWWATSYFDVEFTDSGNTTVRKEEWRLMPKTLNHRQRAVFDKTIFDYCKGEDISCR
ncbi:hypothetical protein ACSLBF_21205 (plasmid) [Pseudoalteromonas sp. T1lg65]|uniref:hypothetical protein n=1 Tax=Pseudoalteromonas sp. T1lg65 TaxID=2077101 RepID=UPI003F79D73F